jgi:hypothetical protein
MSNLAYEMLGRATWAAQKRKVRGYFIPKKKRRGKRAVVVISVLAVGVIVAGAALEHASAP